MGAASAAARGERVKLRERESPSAQIAKEVQWETRRLPHKLQQHGIHTHFADELASGIHDEQQHRTGDTSRAQARAAAEPGAKVRVGFGSL